VDAPNGEFAAFGASLGAYTRPYTTPIGMTTSWSVWTVAASVPQSASDRPAPTVWSSDIRGAFHAGVGAV